MNEEKCENCRFYNKNSAILDEGECRRYPPKDRLDLHDRYLHYPTLCDDDWCGEWQENYKIKNELLNLKYEESFKLHNEYWDALVKSKKLFLEDFKFNKINKCDHIAEENNFINLSYMDPKDIDV